MPVSPLLIWNLSIEKIGVSLVSNQLPVLFGRPGVVKTEKVAVEASGGLFILPPKNSEDADV